MKGIGAKIIDNPRPKQHRLWEVTLDAGYIYAPYIPIFKTPKVNTREFEVTKRYIKKQINKALFGKEKI